MILGILFMHRSLDDLDLIKRRGSLRSQFAVTFSDLSLKSSKQTLSSYDNVAPPTASFKNVDNIKNTSYLIRPLCKENPYSICTSGNDYNTY